MKKLLLTSLLSLGLLLPVSISASTNATTSTTEFSAKKPKKQKTKKSRKSKRSKARSSSRSYAKSKGCTYNGHELIVGPRGGCYYYSGNSKEYVDRSYCSGCN